jgi:hypothetical protein
VLEAQHACRTTESPARRFRSVGERNKPEAARSGIPPALSVASAARAPFAVAFGPTVVYARTGSFIERRHIIRCAYRCVGSVTPPFATRRREAGSVLRTATRLSQRARGSTPIHTSLILPALPSLSACERSFGRGLTLIGLSIAEG